MKACTAPSPPDAIKVAIDEAIRAKELVKQNLLFGLWSGHFDMAAYDNSSDRYKIRVCRIMSLETLALLEMFC